MTDTAGITEALPPFLAVDQEPKTTPPHCQGCDTDEPPPAEYVTDKGLYLCQACGDEDSDGTIHPTRLEPWRIHSVEEAEWSLRKLIEAKAKIAVVDAQADAWKDRIEQWAATQQVKPMEREQFFQSHLEAWAREQREADPKLKTIRLPSGQISSREGRGSIKVVDEEAAIKFLRAYADEMERPVEELLRLKVEIKKDALREILVPAALKEGLALVADGEQVPGLEVPQLTFTVKIAS